MGNQQTFEKFDRFEDLPKPALQEILLKLNRQQLYAICSISRKAFSICTENNFRNMYNNLHPKQMIYGNLRIDSWMEIGDVHRGNWTVGFIDDMESIIKINFNELDVLNYFEYIGNSTFNNKDITFLSKSRIVEWDNAPYTKEELLVRLTEIGKERWIDEFKYSQILKGFVFSKKVAKELWEILEKEIGKIPRKEMPIRLFFFMRDGLYRP